MLEDYRCSLYPELVILPCYSALPAEEQAKIFEPTEIGKRKVCTVFIVFPKDCRRRRCNERIFWFVGCYRHQYCGNVFDGRWYPICH